MNRFISLPGFILLVSLGFTLMACKPDEPQSTNSGVEVTRSQSSKSDDGWEPGLGMNIGNGRLGIEIAPGLVLDSGGNLGIGIGF